MTDNSNECIECNELLELLVDYLDGEATEEVRHRIIIHLQDCPRCTRLFWSMRRTVSYCQMESCCDMPSLVHQRLWEALSQELEAEDNQTDA